ncbi:hypothetical protein ABG067_006191 [Albugo candida]|uniref:Uncharacterized protein n=1 Tax=Albugo candida TaxID=65357 RepID=A0A024G6E9_9STRA|nr:unnamed protein product [Albugo candida]|eukprot:CCI42410.1 unnamed protein product [Albugo candida]
MEIAGNVRDFLVGMKENISPIEEEILCDLQQLHELFSKNMTGFDEEVSQNALNMSPEARIVAHQLRVRIYQDWRSKLMECVFSSELETPLDDIRINGGHLNSTEMCQHSSVLRRFTRTTCKAMVNTIKDRLALYKVVTDHYIHVSIQTKGRPILTPMMLSPTSLHQRMMEQMKGLNVNEAADINFVIPDFLCGFS